MFSKSKATLKSYKLTEDSYREMLINQYFKCKICLRKVVDCGKLEVDHCHQTRRIRGLLCHECNTELGRFEKGYRDFRRSHLIDPEKEYTNYLSARTELVSKYERAAKRIINAYRYS